MPNKRRCPFCKTYNRVEDALVIHRRAYCSIDCAVNYAKKQKPKKQRREFFVAKRKLRDADRFHQIQLTQKSFNSLIRELDRDQPCATCFKPARTYEITAGHFLTRASTPELRFDPRNCYAQCSGCNVGQQKYYRGDRASIRQNFEKTIVERYGQNMLDWLKGPHPLPNESIEELKAMRKVFNAERRRLEKGEGPSKDWREL